MDSLGDRMKTYEAVPKNYLMRRTPVIIRIDGCHFHSFTRKFKKPFDNVFMEAMKWTTFDLCSHIQGCVMGYTQSDEISLVLCDYKRLNSAAWFDDQVQKICSVSASMASSFFVRAFDTMVDDLTDGDVVPEIYRSAYQSGTPYFDARCFNLPVEEVCNYMIWRQQDATRNSILGLAQSLYSHKEMQGVSCKALQDKMFEEKGVNWNDLETPKKRGTCVVRINDGGVRSKWVIDNDIPVFTARRDYVDGRIVFEE